VALPAILRIARGGFSEMFAKSQEPTLDMSRVGMRLDGIQVYATLAALLTNACLELYSNIQVPKAETDNNRPRVIFYLIQNGTGERFRYRITEFWAQSASIQNSGFETFLFSLISFELSFVLSLFLKFKGRRRKYPVALATLIFWLSMRRWTSLLYHRRVSYCFHCMQKRILVL
jgi:hypothetical protein